jgi:predicted AAA+ superfamily ATPase
MVKLFHSTEEKSKVETLLSATGTPRDALPYSQEFDSLFEAFRKFAKRNLEKHDFWRMLSSIAKTGKGKLKKKRNRIASPHLNIEYQLEIMRQFPEGIGGRDRLPYTSEFEKLHKQFTKLTKVNLTKNEYWLSVLAVAKKSVKPKPLFTSEAPLGDLPRNAVSLLEFFNPWWQGKTFPFPPTFRRSLYDKVVHQMENKNIPVVGLKGPRRVGKTTIQEQIIFDKLFFSGPTKKRKQLLSRVMRVQFDDVPQLGAFKEPILEIIRWYEKYILKESINECAQRGEKVYLFLDEVQDLPSWAEQIKSLVDHTNCHVLLTGSSSMRLKQGQNVLAGRISMLEMGPLHLREIAAFRHLGELPPFSDADKLENWKKLDFWMNLLNHGKQHKKVVQAAFDAFSRWGAFPQCHSGGDSSRSALSTMITDAIITRTIENDVPVNEKGQAWDRNLLRETFWHVCKYVGQIIQPEMIRKNLRNITPAGITNEKIYDVLDYLVDTMLIHRIDPLESVLQSRRNGAKYCLCDHFIREIWLQEEIPLSPSILADAQEPTASLAGHIIESLLGYYFSGISGIGITWFPGRNERPEVDYVITIGDQKIPVEVKFSRSKSTRDDIRGLESFCSRDTNNAPFGILITQNESGLWENRGEQVDNIISIPASNIFLLA